MKILKAFKTELNPNKLQTVLFTKNAGCARWAYNWGLTRKIESFKRKERIPSAIDLHKELVILKKSETSWMYEVSKCSPQNKLIDLDRAFDNFFRNCKKSAIGKKGFPQYKLKHKSKDSFKLDGMIRIFSNAIQLPRIGRVRLKESSYIPVSGVKVLSATISRHINHWFVSVQVEIEVQEKSKNNHTIGVDLGIKNLAVCSNGETFGNPKCLQKKEHLLRIRQKSLSRKTKGSMNYKKAANRIAILYYRIANARKDLLHKITSKIINESQVIVLEDLSVSNMLKNRKLAYAISDVGMAEFRRQIEYKAKWYGRQVIIVDRFFPSSKLCSFCGAKKDTLELSERIYKCGCGLEIDRDLNAAKNLANTVRSTGIEAFGDSSSGCVYSNTTKLLSMN